MLRLDQPKHRTFVCMYNESSSYNSKRISKRNKYKKLNK